ncbi:hypothetical protein MSIM_28860 [Mycobacterium simiae]|nr:hypothetical protein MSIM_28860 [Mycobacterium simiae]
MDEDELRGAGHRGQGQTDRLGAPGPACHDYGPLAKEALGRIDTIGGHRRHDLVYDPRAEQADDRSFEQSAPVELTKRLWNADT